MEQNLTPSQILRKKLLTVLKGDRNSITDKHLSITPVEERPEWLEAIREMEEYIINFERNRQIVEAYKRSLARRKERERD